jgi:YesN/AraC family two-component response regulator
MVMIVKSLQVHDVDYKQQQIEYFQIVEHFQMIFKGTVVKNTFQVENNLTMVVFYEISYEQVIPLIENAIRTYQSRYDQQLLVTVSDECTQFDKMAESYSMAKAGLRYRIDNHGLILYSEIEKLNKGRYSYPYDMEKALKTQIIAGNSEGANKALEVILDDIFKHSHSAIRISTARLLSVMLELFSVFYQAMKEEVVQGDIQFLEKLDKAEITNYFKTLLEKILIHYENREWVSETAKIIFGEIDKRFTKDVSLEEIADAIGCSTTTISRIVKNVTGMGFVEYLTKKRMDYAEELLTGTALIVSSISEMVGYNDPNYFIRIFKKTYGYTPNKYRMHKKFNKDFQNA